LLPPRIGKYEILGKLGQGAMGEVFRARDPVLNREVAVKRITAGRDVDETVRRRFRREAEAAAKLAHPNIITVYELGLEGEQLFMAMELLDGMDLKQALASRAMTLDEKLNVALQVCEGVARAHSHEIVHRDLKPANIHILPSGKVKILDFGLAHVSGSEMTSTGMVMGTPHYMSPEQVRGQKADARSDVFALGCVFYELLSGRKPFDAESMHGVLFKIMQEDPVPLGEAAPATPEPIAHVVEKALAKSPADRYPNAADLLAALRQARRALGSRSSARPDPSVPPPAPARGARSPVERGTHSSRSASRSQPKAASPWALAAALALGLAVVAAGGWALRRAVLTPAAPPPTPPPGLDGLARKAVASQVELARRRLEAGLYAEAVSEAEEALKLDPQNAAARQIAEQAGLARKAIDQAASALRESVAAGQPGRVAGAAFDLMKLDPANREAERAATAAGAAFRPRAEEARRLAQEARRQAEKAGSSSSETFAMAVGLEERGAEAMQSGRAAAAARQFLAARLAFERSRGGGR
jgi:tRNA A-37 threonylcarbamoyl transferase component Bud32/tetratricopeptide (TPR) repeat protein